jgi:hypothetical protein
MQKFLIAIILSVISVFVLSQPVFAVDRPVSSIAQYMNNTQISNGELLVNRPVHIAATAGKMTYDQGWTIYNNSINDGNDQDIEFTLQKNFSFDNFEKRYCVTAKDIAPFGVKGKLQLYIGEYTITPGYPVGLTTNRTDFVPTSPLTNQYSKVCSEWTTIKDAPRVGQQRLAIVGGAIVTQGATQISSVSIESR